MSLITDPRRAPMAALLLAVAFLAPACSKKPTTPPPSGEGQMCTTEAKICPDGSGVGRTGPNCEFAPCPAAAAEEGATPPATPEAEAAPTP